MLPSPEDSAFVKIVKIFAIFVFPIIIIGLLVVITFVPVRKQSSSPQTAQEIDAQIQLLQSQKSKLPAH